MNVAATPSQRYADAATECWDSVHVRVEGHDRGRPRFCVMAIQLGGSARAAGAGGRDSSGAGEEQGKVNSERAARLLCL
jgi:hypothetical protein